MYPEICKPWEKIMLYEISRIGKLIETSRIKVARAWRRGNEKLMSNGYRLSVWDNEMF